MKILSFIKILLIIFCSVLPVFTQTILDNFQETQEKLCREQPISQNRTYSFRQVPRSTLEKGAAGPKPWYRKLFPFLKPPLEKYGVDDVRTLKENYGRPAPLGETKRSKAIRANLEQNLFDLEQKVKLSKFDWRENGVKVGAVGNQGGTKGFACNTCWAFATIDAIQIGRQLAATREKREFNQNIRPSARQLVSCMVKKPEEFCSNNWHGSAFDFMLEKGLPLGGVTKYVPEDHKTWECEPDEYLKILTWDFVSPSPQKIASAAEIKKAIILYGSVVSMLSFDNCFWLYNSGVFNEERFRDGSHFVIIIGWDDEKGAWLVKNSYGEDWGEKGFGWIKYRSNNIGQWAAFVVPDPKEEERIINKSKEGEK